VGSGGADKFHFVASGAGISLAEAGDSGLLVSRVGLMMRFTRFFEADSVRTGIVGRLLITSLSARSSSPARAEQMQYFAKALSDVRSARQRNCQQPERRPQD